MNDIEKRKEAIRLYLSQEIVAKISKKLQRSRAWIYKWLSRYKLNPKGNWYEESSRRPKQIKKNIKRHRNKNCIN
ncbi:MAG: helix-turn-helix domain-containing protein [Bacteroidetes bacterium]|nr:helix-turn-helix domain-containing protein [Bacteroidota bacterium]MBU2584059.1 helix-turn-helix domain-containing protein [Bacteroidota bacterium]